MRRERERESVSSLPSPFVSSLSVGSPRKGHKTRRHTPQNKMETNSRTTFVMSLSMIRVLSALCSPIPDCDETFNFWEPMHYVLYGFGSQTWEYAPRYALRSYSYLLPHGGIAGSVAWMARMWQGEEDANEFDAKIFGFYGLRIALALACASCEIGFASAVAGRFGRSVGMLTLLLLALSPGMFFAAPTFLPTTTAMCVVMIAYTKWLRGRLSEACFVAGFGGVACGWPFVGAAFIPLGLHAMSTNGVIRTMGVLVPAVCLAVGASLAVDWAFFGRPVVPALQIVLYNVIGSGGDAGDAVGAELYGTEPWTFFFKNGFLNFNLIFPIALMSPLVVIMRRAFSSKTSSVFMFLSPLFLWFGIMQSRAHKEERFLYLIYPLICFAAAVSLDWGVRAAADGVERMMCTRRRHRRFGAVLVVLVCAAAGVLSVSRVASQVIGFGAPMQLYARLGRHLAAVRTSRAVKNVCVGGEWYRFPSSFFLPHDARLRFVRSSFDGQLPQPFLEDRDASRWSMTSRPRSSFNNVNREEPSSYVDLDACDLLVDLDFRSTRKDWKVDDELSPWFSSSESDWIVLETVPFLDRETCSSLYRAFWIPRVTPANCKHASYVLLGRRESLRSERVRGSEDQHGVHNERSEL